MAADDVKRRNIRGINIPCLRMNSVDYTFKLNHSSIDIVIWGFLYNPVHQIFRSDQMMAKTKQCNAIDSP